MDKYVVHNHLSYTRNQNLFASVTTAGRTYNVINFNPFDGDSVELILSDRSRVVISYNSIGYINSSDKKPHYPWI